MRQASWRGPTGVSPARVSRGLPGSECCGAVGDGGREAYTTIVWGGLLSRERIIAEAEPVGNVEGDMSGPGMRGAVALPWSKTPSRTKGSRRNLETSSGPQSHEAIPGRGRKARSRSCRGTGEGSDEPRSTDEAPEQGREERRRRAWREGGSVGGMADGRRRSGRRTGPSAPCPPPACGPALRSNLRPGRSRRPPARARCGKAACRDLCGGQGEIPVPTATVRRKRPGKGSAFGTAPSRKELFFQ